MHRAVEHNLTILHNYTSFAEFLCNCCLVGYKKKCDIFVIKKLVNLLLAFISECSITYAESFVYYKNLRSYIYVYSKA